jgi:NAD(P)-dependent dehydrogenase (short-subunit alcohol dehydrogenase family)
MEGKVCLVTGSTAGIGKETALALARMGAIVVMVARDPVRGEATRAEIRGISGNKAVHLLWADFELLPQIRQLAQDFKARYQQLHVLVNNAGTIFPASPTTRDGMDTTFVINHLAHFLLTNLLLDVIKESAPARIVIAASAAHFGTIDFASHQGRKRWRGIWPSWRSYNESKLANILFTYELARRLEGTGVTVNCLHPGLVATHAGMDIRGPLGLLFRRYRDPVVRFWLKVPKTFLLTPEQGAETTIYLATSPEVEGISGRYFDRKIEKRTSKRSYDRSLAQQLWQVDTKIVGLDER